MANDENEKNESRFLPSSKKSEYELATEDEGDGNKLQLSRRQQKRVIPAIHKITLKREILFEKSKRK